MSKRPKASWSRGLLQKPTKTHSRESLPDLGLWSGAGNGNRTRAVSLRSASSTAGEAAELDVRIVVSDRG